MNLKVIYRKNIKHNIEYFASFGKKLTIMVKAEAYGHGLVNLAKILKEYDVKLGVANLDEAKRLRNVWKKEILIVEPVKKVQELKKYGFEFVIETLDVLKEAKEIGLLGKCYIKINSGMNRFGVKYDDFKTIKKMAKIVRNTDFKGLLTHFSYLENSEISLLQAKRFAKARSYFSPNISVSMGGSSIVKTDFVCNEYRLGIGFYGYDNENVMPIMTIKSQVLKKNFLSPGEELGYSSGYVAPSKKEIAVIGVGYGDGIRRDLKGYHVKINGKKCEIVGNICMDCMFADVTNAMCQEGDEVAFEDAEDMAKYLKTSPYEVLTSLSNFRGEQVLY